MKNIKALVLLITLFVTLNSIDASAATGSKQKPPQAAAAEVIFNWFTFDFSFINY